MPTTEFNFNFFFTSVPIQYMSCGTDTKKMDFSQKLYSFCLLLQRKEALTGLVTAM